MDRREFVTIIGGSMLATSLAAEAQQAGRIYRIGVLQAASPSTAAPNLDAFREGLRELGHVEGQTYIIEPRWSDGEVDRWPGFASAPSSRQGSSRASRGPVGMSRASRTVRSISPLSVSS